MHRNLIVFLQISTLIDDFKQNNLISHDTFLFEKTSKTIDESN